MTATVTDFAKNVLNKEELIQLICASEKSSYVDHWVTKFHQIRMGMLTRMRMGGGGMEVPKSHIPGKLISYCLMFEKHYCNEYVQFLKTAKWTTLPRSVITIAFLDLCAIHKPSSFPTCAKKCFANLIQMVGFHLDSSVIRLGARLLLFNPTNDFTSILRTFWIQYGFEIPLYESKWVSEAFQYISSAYTVTSQTWDDDLVMLLEQEMDPTLIFQTLLRSRFSLSFLECFLRPTMAPNVVWTGQFKLTNQITDLHRSNVKRSDISLWILVWHKIKMV